MVVTLHQEAIESRLIQRLVDHGAMCYPPPSRMGVRRPAEAVGHLVISLRPTPELPVVGQGAMGEERTGWLRSISPMTGLNAS